MVLLLEVLNFDKYHVDPQAAFNLDPNRVCELLLEALSQCY